MSIWPSTKARRVLAALLRLGWTIKRHSGTPHRILERPSWPQIVFAYHDDVELGPKIRAKIAKQSGLTPGDL